MTCLRCTWLEEEVAFLRAELGLVQAATEQSALRRAGLPPRLAAFAARLRAARGSVLTIDQLMESMPRRWRNAEGSGVKVAVCQLRALIGRESITTVPGIGYALSASGLAALRDIVDPGAPL